MSIYIYISTLLKDFKGQGPFPTLPYQDSACTCQSLPYLLPTLRHSEGRSPGHRVTQTSGGPTPTGAPCRYKPLNSQIWWVKGVQTWFAQKKGVHHNVSSSIERRIKQKKSEFGGFFAESVPSLWVFFHFECWKLPVFFQNEGVFLSKSSICGSADLEQEMDGPEIKFLCWVLGEWRKLWWS